MIGPSCWELKHRYCDLKGEVPALWCRTRRSYDYNLRDQRESANGKLFSLPVKPDVAGGDSRSHGKARHAGYTQFFPHRASRSLTNIPAVERHTETASLHLEHY